MLISVKFQAGRCAAVCAATENAVPTESSQEAPKVSRRPSPRRAPPKPRVLICDDSRIVRASIAQHLRDRFEMREVKDGEAAWQAILLDSSIRVVISDLTMPKVDGFELLESSAQLQGAADSRAADGDHLRRG